VMLSVSVHFFRVHCHGKKLYYILGNSYFLVFMPNLAVKRQSLYREYGQYYAPINVKPHPPGTGHVGL